MSSSSCASPTTFYNGNCYYPCPDGYEEVDNLFCRQKCPFGFANTDTACIRADVAKSTYPIIQCPNGATRVYDKCLLACPSGTTEEFELCIPNCPFGFVESPDGGSCISELIPRQAVLREACYQGETRSGNYCLQPCPENTNVYALDETVCYRQVPPEVSRFFVTYNATSAKVNFQRTIVPTVCPTGTTLQNGECHGPCPDGTSSDGSKCLVQCPSGFANVGVGACLRPTINRVQAVSRFSVFDRYLRYAFIILAVFIGFNFVRKFFGRR